MSEQVTREDFKKAQIMTVLNKAVISEGEAITAIKEAENLGDEQFLMMVIAELRTIAPAAVPDKYL